MNESTKISLIKWLLVALLCFAVGALTALWNNHRPFTKEQRLIIRQSDSVMYVTTWPEDSAILRTPCADLTKAELKSKDLKTLTAKMLKTLRSPQQDGVGIAAPQVGISKRIIWLQRFDKDGGPFEERAHRQSLRGHRQGPGRMPFRSADARPCPALYLRDCLLCPSGNA